MSPSHRVLLGALTIGVLLAPAVAVPVLAQDYEAARRSLDFAPDPLARSPRLLGMGRLGFVVDDPNNRLTLWDFAGNPTGILEDDSVSTLEFRPATWSASSVHGLLTPAGTIERQDLGAREARLGLEAWHRSKSTAYGLIGDAGQMRWDRPYDRFREKRSQISQPLFMPVLTGRLPYVKSGRMNYALRVYGGGEDQTDDYLTFVSNAAGEYLDKMGDLLNAPDFVTPDEYSIQVRGGGTALSYRFGKSLTAALGADAAIRDIKGTNEGARYASEIRERRPSGSGQASLIGRFGDHLEWGADGRGWTSTSQQNWLFTTSAGLQAVPLSGRGKLLDREEKGTTMHTRLRWVQGAIEFGAGLNTGYRQITITPPAADDPTSFNAFRNAVYYRFNADTLALADSVVANRSEEREWEAAAGLSWQLPNRRGVVGAEFHHYRDHLDQRLELERKLERNLLGDTVEVVSYLFTSGPRRVRWDVRAGLEYRVNPVLTGRAGYIYRRDDRDQFTNRNEFVGHTLTLGAGIRPAGTTWSLETGYAVEWLKPDFGDPTEARSSRQQLAAQVRWTF
jgi:hypothetical protein